MYFGVWFLFLYREIIVRCCCCEFGGGGVFAYLPWMELQFQLYANVMAGKSFVPQS